MELVAVRTLLHVKAFHCILPDGRISVGALREQPKCKNHCWVSTDTDTKMNMLTTPLRTTALHARSHQVHPPTPQQGLCAYEDLACIRKYPRSWNALLAYLR